MSSNFPKTRRVFFGWPCHPSSQPYRGQFRDRPKPDREKTDGNRMQQSDRAVSQTFIVWTNLQQRTTNLSSNFTPWKTFKISHFNIQALLYFVKNCHFWKSAGSSVVRTQCFHCQGQGSIPGRGTKILQALSYSLNNCSPHPTPNQKTKKTFISNPSKTICLLTQLS